MCVICHGFPCFDSIYRRGFVDLASVTQAEGGSFPGEQTILLDCITCNAACQIKSLYDTQSHIIFDYIASIHVLLYVIDLLDLGDPSSVYAV